MYEPIYVQVKNKRTGHHIPYLRMQRINFELLQNVTDVIILLRYTAEMMSLEFVHLYFSFKMV